MLETVADAFTVVGGIFAIYWALFLHQLGKIKAPGGAAHYLGELDVHRSRGDRYHALLERGLDGLDRFFDRYAAVFGSRPWGRAPITSAGLLACVGISLAYTASLLLVTWGFGGSGSMGGYPILSEAVPTWQRGVLLIGLIIYVVFLFFLFRKRDSLAEWLKNKIASRQNRILYMILDRVGVGRGAIAEGEQQERIAARIESIAWLIAGAGTVAVAGAVAGAVGGTVVLALVIAGAGTGAGTVAAVGAGALAGVVAVAGAVAIALLFTEQFSIHIFVPLVLFLILLPWVNGLLDWISWIVTRALGRRLLKRPGWVALVGHGAADLVAAVVLLAALAFLLAGSVEGVSQWVLGIKGKPLLDMDQILTDVGSDPFGPKGLWVTSMLVTTLFPTLLHVMVLVYTLTSVSWLSPTLLAGLAERLRPNGEGKVEEPRLDPVAHFFTAWWLVCLLLALLLFGALGGLIYHLLPSLGEGLLWAAQAGVDGARWLF